MDNVAKEKINDAERDALRVDIAKAVFAAMYTTSQGGKATPDADPAEYRRVRIHNSSMDTWRAARAVDAANFLIAELELAQKVERVIFEEGDSEIVAPPSAMKCVHGIPASETCPLCDETDAADRAEERKTVSSGLPEGAN